MVVLDTSVIVKWFVEEEGPKRALIWMKKHIEGTEVILVPSLFFYEVTNVLRYNKSLPTTEILKIVKNLMEINLRVAEINSELIKRSVVLAREKDISVYDGAFIALADMYETPFYTADKALYKKTKDLGFVNLL